VLEKGEGGQRNAESGVGNSVGTNGTEIKNWVRISLRKGVGHTMEEMSTKRVKPRFFHQCRGG